MQETASIGGILRQAREERGLALQEVHDVTKITAQNLAALEEDRFEAFPNKVYARAFLRDYANFLSLDSASLVTRYEEEWGGSREVEPITPARTAASPRRFIYALLIILALGGASVGSYYWWTGYEKSARSPRVAARDRSEAKERVSPVLPVPPAPEKPESQARPPEPASEPKPAAPAAPSAPVTPAAPEKVVLEVTVLPNVSGVWVGVWSDGKKVHDKSISGGGTKTFEGKQSVRIRVGMAGAVQLKLNGEPQPSLGSMKVVGDKTFALPASPPAPAPASPAKPPQTH